MNKQEFSHLRVEIDALAKLSNNIKHNGGVVYQLNSFTYVEKCTNDLLSAKAWLGKAIATIPNKDLILDQRHLLLDRVEEIAEACHEANKAYCELIGDNSQPSWKDAPDWQKESAIKGVEFALTTANPNPEASHESWLKEKKETGWKYGKVKDPEKKEHPCFMPYEELSEEQKAKDEIFIKTIASFQYKTPYINDGKRNTVADILPTADTVLSADYPEDKETAIQKADYLRELVAETTSKVQYEAYIASVNVNSESDYLHVVALQNAYSNLCSARFDLGFLLEHIREHGL